METKSTLLLVLVFSISYPTQARISDAVVNSYREYLFRTWEQEPGINEWLHSLNEKQQWPDINYPATERGNWQLLRHLRRTRSLALAWAKPDSPYYHHEEVWKTIDAALNHWLEKRYQNPNWWHNQIGVPRYMRDIVIALGDKLAGEQLKQALEVLAQLRVQENGVGANLIWSADLGFHYGALTNNMELMEHCRKLILQEIKISTGEGVQPDYSFHQHGNRLQMYQYGKAFLWETARLAWQVRETPMAFPEEKTDILAEFILNGWQWMARGVNTVPGTMDRSSSRIGELRSADIRTLIPFLCELRPGLANKFEAVSERQNGKGALKGFRYYPYSDFSAYHHSKFSFFLKTISARTLATESINRENLKGRLLNSGDAYLIHDGDEYYNLMPVWDWTKLPGVTSFKGAGKIGRKHFAGSVGDRESGLTAMDYHMMGRDSTQFLSARKIWARHGNTVVALMANLQAENINNVFTALDQSRWRGDVTVDEPGNVLEAGNHVTDNVQWLHHKNFAYIPLEPSSFDVRLNEVTGKWSSINASESNAPVTEKVFLPVMFHEVRQEQTSTGYVLAYSETPEQTEALAEHPTWKVLRNDKSCQAVKFGKEKLMVAFYSPGTLKISEHDILTVDKPSLVLISDNEIHISDPMHKGGPVKINFNDQEWNMSLPQDGTTVKKSL